MLHPAADRIDLDATLAHFAAHGWARLGRVLEEDAAEALRRRADDLMLGRVTYPGMFFQADSASGRYDDLAFGLGWRGPSLAYRKLEKLELDPLYRAWIENPLFGRIAHAVIGSHVALLRAVLWTKAARGGTELPWHQDGGKFWGLDRDPILQVWTALDEAPLESGCVEILPGSHRAGLVTPAGGNVPTHAIATADADQRAIPIPVRAGEALLIHNHVWHRSGRNATEHARRAISICFMYAATRCTRKKNPRTFLRVFGA